MAKELAGAPASEKTLMIRALGASGKQRGVKRLLEDFDVRSLDAGEAGTYARALGDSRLQSATDPLLSAWEHLEGVKLGSSVLSSEVSSLRADIAAALAEIADIKAIPVLRRAMSDEDARVVRAALEGLGRLKDARSADWIINLSGSADADTARAALEALGELGGEKAEAALLRAAEGTRPELRVAAAYSLARLGRARGFLLLDGFLEEVDGAYPEGLLAARYLGRLGRLNGIDYLARAGKNADSSLRLVAIEALGGSGDPRAALPLAELSGDSDAPVRLAAVLALWKVGTPRAVRALKRAAKKDADAGVRSAAREALAALGRYVPRPG